MRHLGALAAALGWLALAGVVAGTGFALGFEATLWMLWR